MRGKHSILRRRGSDRKYLPSRSASAMMATIMIATRIVLVVISVADAARGFCRAALILERYFGLLFYCIDLSFKCIIPLKKAEVSKKKFIPFGLIISKEDE